MDDGEGEPGFAQPAEGPWLPRRNGWRVYFAGRNGGQSGGQLMTHQSPLKLVQIGRGRCPVTYGAPELYIHTISLLIHGVAPLERGLGLQLNHRTHRYRLNRARPRN